MGSLPLVITHHYPSPELINSALTYDFQTSIGMELAYITSMEPSHAISVFFKVFSGFRWIIEIAAVDDWTANHDLSSGVRFIRDCVVSFTMLIISS